MPILKQITNANASLYLKINIKMEIKKAKRLYSQISVGDKKFRSVRAVSRFYEIPDCTIARWIREEFEKTNKHNFSITKRGLTFKVQIF